MNTMASFRLQSEERMRREDRDSHEIESDRTVKGQHRS
jgi:hypothetical protein